MIRAALSIVALSACGRLGFDATGDDASASDGGVDDGNNMSSRTDAAVIVGGGAWTTFSPPLGSATDLFAAWGFGANDVWVGGPGGFIRQFNGTSWVTRTGFGNEVYSMWGAAPNDLWIVGQQCEVKRWNGSALAPFTIPGCTNQSFFAIAGLSATDVWLAGVGGRIDHITDNTNFASFPQGSNVDFWSVAPISATEAYFVGTKGIIKHWTGSAFVDESISQNIVLTSVWGASSTDIWAVGAAGFIFHKTGSGAFTQVTSPTTSFLYWVWGTAPNDIWALGAGGTLIHYDGATWGLVATPVTTPLRVLAAVPGDGLRIVGHGGVVLTHP